MNISYSTSIVTNSKINSSSSPETSVTITTKKGHPVFVSISGDLNCLYAAAWCQIYLSRDNEIIKMEIIEGTRETHNVGFAFTFLDSVPIGTYTYKIRFVIGSGSMELNENGGTELPQLLAFEI